ncbi:MAG: uracil-xanthine permease family protein [Lachnospiraceae bacterium]|jgi:uracil permease
MAKKETVQIGQKGIDDARVLGTGRMVILGLQHTFAMFGATVLVPLLTGLDMQTTLLMAGLGTLLFHLITGRKVPIFLGSSFAFLGGYAAVKAMTDAAGLPWTEGIPYACLGVAVAGLVYLILAGFFAAFDVRKVMRFFPPVVTGPIIIAIGLSLAGSAVSNCSTNWLIAVISLAVVIICNIWGRGMIKIIPILMGVAVGVLVSVVLALAAGQTVSIDGSDVICIAGNTSLQLFSEDKIEALKQAAWFGLPVKRSEMIFGNIHNAELAVSAIVAVVPISFASMMEHIGDISAVSATTEHNFLADPGLKRTLVGDGLATTFSALFGGPANTTYGENTGVLALTKVYDPKVVRIAACFAILLSFSPKIAAAINLLPTSVIGGISFILYGMISGVGIRNVVENQVDFTKSRNLIITAVILVCALGITDGFTFKIGSFNITLTALAIAAIAGIVLNAILPGNDYEFKMEDYQNGKDATKVGDSN